MHFRALICASRHLHAFPDTLHTFSNMYIRFLGPCRGHIIRKNRLNRLFNVINPLIQLIESIEGSQDLMNTADVEIKSHPSLVLRAMTGNGWETEGVQGKSFNSTKTVTTTPNWAIWAAGRDSTKIVSNISKMTPKQRGWRPKAAGPSVSGSNLEY